MVWLGLLLLGSAMGWVARGFVVRRDVRDLRLLADEMRKRLWGEGW